MQRERELVGFLVKIGQNSSFSGQFCIGKSKQGAWEQDSGEYLFLSAYWANCIDRYAMCRFFDEKMVKRVVPVYLFAGSRVNFNEFLGFPDNSREKNRNSEGFLAGL